MMSRGSRREIVALSSCEAEIIALRRPRRTSSTFASSCVGSARPARTDVTGVTGYRQPERKGRVVQPEHHDRMKHVQRRHFFIRDMVESHEIEVPFVRTGHRGQPG